MQKRDQLILDDTHYDFETPEGAEVYAGASYTHNWADSIWWARQRCKDDAEVRALIFELRTEFRTAGTSEFPDDILFGRLFGDDQDPNHFLSMLERFVEYSGTPSLQTLALSICKKLKRELNLDLHPSLFEVKRPSD